jgi:hypothetical protein
MLFIFLSMLGNSGLVACVSADLILHNRIVRALSFCFNVVGWFNSTEPKSAEYFSHL